MFAKHEDNIERPATESHLSLLIQAWLKGLEDSFKYRPNSKQFMKLGLRLAKVQPLCQQLFCLLGGLETVGALCHELLAQEARGKVEESRTGPDAEVSRNYLSLCESQWGN